MYADLIRVVLQKIGRPEVDPRHVEGWMRSEHPTLDGLSKPRFAREVKIAVACVDEGGRELAERVALSYGLRPTSSAPPPQEHDCNANAVPYVDNSPEAGPLGHGWVCGVCNELLQVG